MFDIAQHIESLEKLCHKKGCPETSLCPMTHPDCSGKLDTQTAIAWSMATTLEKLVAGELSLRETTLIAYFCFHTLGQHSNEEWFRKDIFKEFDGLSILLDNELYGIGGAKSCIQRWI